ncbi:MAG: divalent metal cation transporter [Nitrosopumilaceae archaeon]|nr:divalent metal cation transporter [Nitrosopumilaceae archaeon]
MNERYQQFLKTFGPGMLFASTAIGVSHLIQSTRAGAEFGFLLLGVVCLANLFKYPFFEFSSRYSNVTGTSIIDGYLRLGKPVLVLYLIITLASMFIITAAVSFVTAGFFENLFGVSFLGVWSLVILFGVCIAILASGKYRTFDSLIKIISAVMVVSTTTAFVIALINGPAADIEQVKPPEILTQAGILFLVALMGWMPMPVDISSWHGLWTLERIKQTNFRPRLKETLLDFNIGYLVTSILAVFFVFLGAYIFFGSPEPLPNNNALFADKVVNLYTETIGSWSYLIIASSAFSVMFGTIVAVFDGYSRSIVRITQLLVTKNENEIVQATKFRKTYLILLLALAAGSLIVVIPFGNNLTQLVDFATVVSFLIAPIIAIFNYRLVTGKYLAKGGQPPAWLKGLGIAGIAFLIGFAVFFIVTRF